MNQIQNPNKIKKSKNQKIKKSKNQKLILYYFAKQKQNTI